MAFEGLVGAGEDFGGIPFGDGGDKGGHEAEVAAAKGAPAGDYRVQVEKEPLAEHWKTPEEQSKMSKPEKDAYLDEWLAKCAELPREVPKIWNDYDKTPLTATVPAGGGEVTFDVEGKAEN